MADSDFSHSLEHDITTFGCYTIGQLLTPSCWIYSFKLQRPVRMKDPTCFNRDFPFLNPEILLNKHDITREEIALMHEQDLVDEGVEDDETEVDDSEDGEFCTPPTQPDPARHSPAPLAKPMVQQLPSLPAPSPVPEGVQTRARSRQHTPIAPVQNTGIGGANTPSPLPLPTQQPFLPSKHQEGLHSSEPETDRNPCTWTTGAKVPMDA
mmetsp:Transcript_29630/g.60809  ORF Transcript_29630/g.60809 Transcript_29630/m.60809 type:complete len:209 (-) Transcript_29630:313-939(-)